MAADRSPPPKSPQHHVRPNSSSSTPAAVAGQLSRMPTPGQSSRRGSADSPSPKGAVATLNEPPSQPMTASASPSEAAGTEPPSTSATPAPYGTRSRGRNAAPRPNYAEDRDIDMDIDVTQAQPKSGKRTSGIAPTTAPSGSKPEGEKSAPTSNSRKSQTAVNGSNPASAAKDSIPGTSSFSAKPEETNGASNSRKRKQPASATSSCSANGSVTKKIFTAAPGISPGHSDSNMVSFENSGAYLQDGKLVADDGTTFAVNDHVYLICEPPGEPYYLARIMEFFPSKNTPSGPIEALRVNWYYRPRDIQRNVTDPRLVFASMHSDPCPLTSLRGKCQIMHSSEIKDLDEYRKTWDCFWFEKMYDRYTHRYYDIINTKTIINVPANVKKVLDERWKFILVEVGKRKELFNAVKLCKRCSLYAASNNSVDCAVCHNTYHMQCVRPVLAKKPARGFAWACAACSRAQERKLEARNTPILGESHNEAEEEVVEEEEEDPNSAAHGTAGSTPATAEEEAVRPATEEQVAQARMWPYRYLGIHCRVEDALDYDDRIYPRASSRLGPRHQATVNPWYGHTVEYVKPISDIKKRYMKGSSSRKDSKLSKEAHAAAEAAKQEKANRPKWVEDEPTGYIRRGEDEPVLINGKQARTAELLFKMPSATDIPSRGEEDAPGADLSPEDREKFIDQYMERAKEIAPDLGVEKFSTNFLDKALELLYANSFDADAALAKLKQMNKHKDLKEPNLRPEQLKAFEKAVSLYGSEWRFITKHVKTVPHHQIVRFYYMWKKTPRGRQIWGSFEGRRGKKEAKRSSSAKLVDDVADDHDDSAFDNDKAIAKKRGFECKFCSTRTSRQWRRAPGVPPTTTISSGESSKQKEDICVALCLRCALIWRKYGMQWESVDEVAKKINQSSSKSSGRRRVDEELLAQLLLSIETPISINPATAAAAAAIGVPVNANPQVQQESTKKKGRTTDKDSGVTSTATSVEPAPKKKPPTEKVPEPPPIVPDPPKAKTLPCAICDQMEPMGDQHLSCRDCRLTVHRGCYGVSPSRNSIKWLCDMCSNDRNPMISTCYECVLCPVTWTDHELMEAPKSTHKKKTERDREKERLEKEMVNEAIKLYRQRQEAVGKPIGPREPLKRTAGNNWVHVMCAIWTPEIKFGNAKELEPAEGFALIPRNKHQETCKICKEDKGPCVTCHFSGCNAQFHVGCAFQAHYTFGFDITPAKNSRRDSVNSIRLGDEVGVATAGIWCPHHTVPPVVHAIGEMTEKEGVNALQRFAESYKQADLSLTVTVRRAANATHSFSQPRVVPFESRRASAVNGVKDALKNLGTSPVDGPDEMDIDSDNHAPVQIVGSDVTKKCARCSTAYSPRWWPMDKSRRTTIVDHRTPLLNGVGLNDAAGARYPSAASASPPFLHRNPSQHSLPKLNGDYSPADRSGPANGIEGASGHPSQTLYECHKCHLKKIAAQPTQPPQPSPEPRPSPYSAQRPVLPAPRLPEYHNHPFGPHAHPPQTGAFPRPIGPPPHSGPEWYPGHEQRPGEYGDNKVRNSIPVPSYRGGHPLPPAHHINGYQPTPPHHAPPPHYSGGAHVPPPTHQPYSTHQSPYGPVSMPSPHPSHAVASRPFAPSASPPDVQATMVRHSPQHSLSALNGGPPPRVYSVDRVLKAPTQSPPVSQAHVNHRGLTPPGKLDGTPIPATAGPLSSSRHTANGTNGGSGASASPSLKNLLS